MSEPGISQKLAESRAASIADIHYNLTFTLPAASTEAIEATVIIRFSLRSPTEVVLDFAHPKDRVHSISAKPQPTYTEDHIIIPAAATHTGENSLTIQFRAGDEALNRNPDFLYTLFVPARAHLAFPCFDQPDLKARFTLTLTTPPTWQSVSNAPELSPGHFAETLPVSTYLFAFAAGKFNVETTQRNGRTFRMFHRETDPAKVARNREAIFDLHAHALTWLEDYTAIPYPWGKFDFVLLPAFQFGGMEHPGAIFYNAPSLLLDESATQNQQLARANVISHETAHMWFGDLVTMRWFNDVWMKEVMANFMAGKIVNPSFPTVDHPLRFLLENFPTAYSVDRTAGANPIRQPLANLSEAGTLYGAIIYQKAPIVMRQLESLTGTGKFRNGLRAYLSRYKFSNATWPDLINVLDPSLRAWSQTWVETRGRPRIFITRDVHTITLTQQGSVWPQRFAIGETAVNITGPITTIKTAQATPYVVPDGYGLFILDPASRAWLLQHIEDIPTALTRGSAWIVLYDNLLEARLSPHPFIDTAMRALPREADEQMVQRILGYVTATYWKFTHQEQAPALEALLRQGIVNAKSTSEKSAWFNALVNTSITPATLNWLGRVWSHQEKIEGLPLSESDEITLAMELAVREVPGWQQVLETERQRIQNPDRKARFEFVIPALSADPQTRLHAFERFIHLQNRRHEPWVTEALRYLNHPLRQRSAIATLPQALNLISEIQRTGDIFFPRNWLEALLAGHNSPQAASIVMQFLARNQELPQRLRWTIQSSADQLFRAQPILKL